METIMACPTDEELSVYLEGGGSPEERESVRTHAEGCATCRAMVGAFFQAFGAVSEEADTLPASSVPSSALPRGTRVGRYTVDERLGAGGMGVVYAARDVALGRRVALKLLGGRATARKRSRGLEQTMAAQARLQREAQMMAKLGDPHVVTVYEVGEVGDEVFVAMELVEGQTLRGWLKEEKRSTRAILEVFEQIGRGLVAAHAAKIVHRDVKPENVLVGRDGRVRITDFGLAEIVAETTQQTRVGMLIGTPAYMAPEQLEGRAADERADQFAFAVMLWEALHGERPYAGDTIESILGAMKLRALRPPKRFVPAPVRRALRRALEPDREDRFPTLAPFVEALEKPRLRRRELLVGAAFVIVASVASTLFARRTHAPPEPCKSSEDPLALVWDGPSRARLAAHAREVAPAIAEEVLGRTLPTLDAFGASYRAMRISTCEATRIRGEQSEAMLDLRMACLDRRKQELAALVDLLARGDLATVAHAPRAALALSPLSTCADATALAGPSAPAPSARDAVATVRAELARAEAMWLAGNFAQGLPIAQAASARAAASGDRAAEAEALFLRARLEEGNGLFSAARDTLLVAISRAEAGHHDALAVQIWAMLTRLSGSRLDKQDDARAYEARARAALERANDPPSGRLALALAVAAVRRTRGEYASAVSAIREVLATIAGHEGEYVVQHIELLAELARAERDLGAYADAESTLSQAIALTEAKLGPNHPDVATLLEIRAMVASRKGDHAAAIAAYERVAKLRETLLGPKHSDVGQAKANLATAYTRAGKPREAVPLLTSALEVMLATFGPEHPNVAQTEGNLGFAYLRMNDLPPARVHLERAIAIGEKSLGPKHPTLAIWMGNLARVEIGQGQPQKAIELLERALSIEEAALGPKHVDLAFNLTALGEAFLAKNDPVAARAPLERAVALREAGAAAKEKLAQSRFALARALATLAEEGFEGAGVAAEKDREAVRAWLSEH
jgi:tetratricopeptide (TPR) repeat protein/tRNA A-37 threonylcarbamoyl transferase component Bud32